MNALDVSNGRTPVRPFGPADLVRWVKCAFEVEDFLGSVIDERA